MENATENISSKKPTKLTTEDIYIELLELMIEVQKIKTDTQEIKINVQKTKTDVEQLKTINETGCFNCGIQSGCDVIRDTIYKAINNICCNAFVCDAYYSLKQFLDL